MLAQESAFSIIFPTFIGALILLVVSIVFFAISELKTHNNQKRIHGALNNHNRGVSNNLVTTPPVIEPSHKPPKPSQINPAQNETKRNEPSIEVNVLRH